MPSRRGPYNAYDAYTGDGSSSGGASPSAQFGWYKAIDFDFRALPDQALVNGANVVDGVPVTCTITGTNTMDIVNGTGLVANFGDIVTEMAFDVLCADAFPAVVPIPAYAVGQPVAGLMDLDPAATSLAGFDSFVSLALYAAANERMRSGVFFDLVDSRAFNASVLAGNVNAGNVVTGPGFTGAPAIIGRGSGWWTDASAHSKYDGDTTVSDAATPDTPVNELGTRGNGFSPSGVFNAATDRVRIEFRAGDWGANPNVVATVRRVRWYIR